MKYLKRLLLASCLLGFSLGAYATPTLQVHAVDSVAGSISGDEQTWFVSGATGDLELIATFDDPNMSIQNAYLVLTTSATAGNPFAGFSKYDDAAAFEATLLGGAVQTNNHAPYGGAASDIDTFAYSLGDFSYGAGTSPSKDCNADVTPGTTECTSSNGTADIKMFSYDYSGLALDWVHFDLVAFVTDQNGNSGRWASTWDINPGSHDSTWVNVPETNSLFLLMVGLLGLLGFKRKTS